MDAVRKKVAESKVAALFSKVKRYAESRRASGTPLVADPRVRAELEAMRSRPFVARPVSPSEKVGFWKRLMAGKAQQQLQKA